MKYKYVALDIDGTIVPEGASIVSKRVKETIRKAAKKAYVSIVTARSKSEAQAILDELQLPQVYHVIENGAKVLDPEGNIAFNIHIPQEEVQEILDITNPYFAEFGLCIDSQWIDENAKASEGLVTGISFTCHDSIQGHLLHQAILNLPNDYYIYVGRHWQNHEWAGILVTHKDATKGKGMQFVQEKINVDIDGTIAVGDTGFDAPMFEYAGLKVAMENGEQVLKDQADVVAKHVDEEGLVEILEEYVLKKKK